MTVEKIECWVFRAPIERPVTAAVGSMTNRPAVFVRIRADDGAWGWGEVFCNFPTVGAEHRARLLREVVAPLLQGMRSDQPGEVWAALTAKLRRMALQAGEPGPVAQVLAAVDQALWDMQARRAGKPLWRLLADDPSADGRVRPYASGLGPDGVVEAALAAGENIRGHADFDAAIAAGHLRFIQPDVAKWGGITGCLEVARRAERAGLVYCPHWLGGGIGLAAPLHLRAALGPTGLAEIDANPNPLREAVFALPPMYDGWLTLPEAPGLGVEPDLAALRRYRSDA